MKLKKGKLVALLLVIFCSLFAVSCELLNLGTDTGANTDKDKDKESEETFILLVVNETNVAFTFFVDNDNKGSLDPNSRRSFVLPKGTYNLRIVDMFLNTIHKTAVMDSHKTWTISNNN